MFFRSMAILLMGLVIFSGSVFAGEKEDVDQFMNTLQDAQEKSQNGETVDTDAVYQAADKVSGTENTANECYFDTAEDGKYSNLKDFEGDVQISSQTTNAMLKYNEYRKAIATKAPQSDIDELWNQHVICAKLAIQVYQTFSGN